MLHYKNFHDSIAKINDSIIFHTFCSKQVSIDIEEVIKNYNSNKPLDKVTIRQVFNSNNISHRYNKKIKNISNDINKANSFIYDNSLILIYLQIEIYAREIYQSLQKIEKKYKEKNKQLELDKFKLIQSNNLQSLEQKLSLIKASFLKNNISLQITKINIKEKLKENQEPLLIDLNTTQIVKTVLLNLGVIIINNEDYKLSTIWEKRISKQDIPIVLYLDTLEYFRLRRNVITHRKLSDRINGSFGEFVVKKGKYLNEKWDELLLEKDRFINFEAKENISFTEHSELIETIIIIRKIINELNVIFEKVFSNNELVKYYYWEFSEMRENKKKGKFNLSTHFDRFYAKFEGYLKENAVKLDIGKEDVKTLLLK